MDGLPVLTAGPNATILTGSAPFGADTEITVRFRFALSATRATTFWLTAGLKKPQDNDANPLTLALSVPAGLETETVQWQLPPLPGRSQGLSGPYTIRDLPRDRLT